MTDLEERIRQKQVERLPISRGGVLLNDLATRHPNLADEILEEHEARKFVSALGASVPSSYGATSGPAAPKELRRPQSTSKSSIGRKQKKSLTPTANSPVLRAIGSDLIFDVEDDSSPSPGYVRPQETASNPWRDPAGKPVKEQPPTFSAKQRFRLEPESICAAGHHEMWTEIKPIGTGYTLSQSVLSNRFQEERDSRQESRSDPGIYIISAPDTR